MPVKQLNILFNLILLFQDSRFANQNESTWVPLPLRTIFNPLGSKRDPPPHKDAERLGNGASAFAWLYGKQNR